MEWRQVIVDGEVRYTDTFKVCDCKEPYKGFFEIWQIGDTYSYYSCSKKKFCSSYEMDKEIRELGLPLRPTLGTKIANWFSRKK